MRTRSRSGQGYCQFISHAMVESCVETIKMHFSSLSSLWALLLARCRPVWSKLNAVNQLIYVLSWSMQKKFKAADVCEGCCAFIMNLVGLKIIDTPPASRCTWDSFRLLSRRPRARSARGGGIINRNIPSGRCFNVFIICVLSAL